MLGTESVAVHLMSRRSLPENDPYVEMENTCQYFLRKQDGCRHLCNSVRRICY